MALTTITGNMVSVNAIQGTLIADNAITAVHIASNAVTSIQIAENNVTAREIASNSITVAQLADASVESDKIANGVITTNHLNSAMISSQTEVTAVAGDFVLLGDTSDSNNLKKAPVSSIVALAGVADGAVTSAKLDTNIAIAGTLGVTGDITGTLATAAQPNITSVGSLTALDVTGTATMDGLTVDGSSSLQTTSVGQLNISGLTKITGNRGTFVDPSEDPSVPNIFATNDAVGDFSQEAGHLIIQPRVHPTVFRDVIFAGGAGTTKRLMTIQGEGDISFYEDTGTTPKFFWDASAESLGIGTTSPDALLEINKGSEGEYLRIGGDNSSNARSLRFTSSASSSGSNGALHTIKANSIAGEIAFANGDGTIMYLKDGGNVGIGTTNPAQPLHVLSSTALTAGVARFQYSGGNDYEVIRVESLGNNDAQIGFFADGDTNYYGGFGIDYSDAGKFKLQTDNLFVGGSNLMTWARDGKVGIGTTNPSETLHLNAGGSGPELRFENASGSHYIRAYNDNWNFLANSTNTAMTIRNSGQVEFGGKVGIGTNDPSSGYGGAISDVKLAILSGTAGSDGGSSTILIGGDNKHYAYMQGTHISGGATQLDFGTASGAVNPTLKMRIASNGSIGAPSGTNIYNASDERLKQNISTLSNSLDVINALNPVKFNWIDNFEESENDKTLYGFVAQEVQETFPDAVESFGNDVEVDGTVVENPLTVRDKFFIPVLVKAIQEQQALIESLTTRLETLENA